jgi:hypothetical protein
MKPMPTDRRPQPPQRTSRRTTPVWAARRGVAMLLVLGVIVMGSVLGYAMLSSAALQRQISANASATAGAQGMAESGVNLAIYYLNSIDKAPTYPAAYPGTEEYDRLWKYWNGTRDANGNLVWVDFGSPAIGSVMVDVRRRNPAKRWEYEIESWGRGPGSAVTRRVKATVQVNAEFRVEHAGVFTNDVQLTGGTVFGQSGVDGGATYSNGGLSIRSGGYVYGRATRRRTVLTQAQPTPTLTPYAERWAAAPHVPKVVPQFTEVRHYQSYEYPAGAAKQAVTLTSGATIGAGYAIDRLEPSAANPAGVFIAPGDVTLRTGAEVRGTLIVTGHLKVIGNDIRIRATDGFPALVVAGNVNFGDVLSLTNPNLYVEGLVYVAGRIDGVGLTPTFDIRGGLLVGGTSPVFVSQPLARLLVRYDADKARVPDFSDAGRTVQSVRILDWEAQGP